MTPAHRTEAVLTEDGKLSLDNLPFRAGQAVEVIVRPADVASRTNGRTSPSDSWSRLVNDLRAIHDADGAPGRSWPELIDDLRAVRNLGDDWDGQGAKASPTEVVDGAIAWASDLQAAGSPPADFAIAGVNGTIFFEWHDPSGFLEIEVTAPGEAEGRLVRTGSDVAEVFTLSRQS